jgi:hypothetical protein
VKQGARHGADGEERERSRLGNRDHTDGEGRAGGEGAEDKGEKCESSVHRDLLSEVMVETAV